MKQFVDVYVPLLLFLLVFVNGASAIDYYVNNSWAGASDSNTGLSNTNTAAWLTIQKAANMMVAGDTVYVSGTNEYNEEISITTSGNATHWITYIGNISSIGDRPFINYSADCFDIAAEYVSVSGFKLTAQSQAFEVGDLSYPPPANSMDHIIIAHNTIDCPSGSGIYVGYVNDTTVEWNNISAYADTISWKSGYTFGQDVSNNIISHNRVWCDSGYGSLYVGRYTENITVSYNYVNGSGWNAINIGEADNSYVGYNEVNGTDVYHQLMDARPTNTVFEGNYFHDSPTISGSHMLYICRSDGLIPENLTIKDTRIENFGGSDDAFELLEAIDITIENLTINNGSRTGLRIGAGAGYTASRNISLSNVTITDCEAYGIRINRCFDCMKIVNYTAYGNTYDMFLDDGDAEGNEVQVYLVNSNFSTISHTGDGDELYKVRVGYFVDILVKDENGDPVDGAEVTFTNLNDSNFPCTSLDGDFCLSELAQTSTTSEGHTPLPTNEASTAVLLDYTYNGTGTKYYYIYNVTVTKSGYTNYTTINTDSSWYRKDAETYQNTTTIILTGYSEPNGETQWSPSIFGAYYNLTDPLEITVKGYGDFSNRFSRVPTQNDSNATQSFTMEVTT